MNEEHTTVPTTADWSNPVLKPFASMFQNLADTVVRNSELGKQVEDLQRTVDTLQNTLQTLMNERSTLRSELFQTRQSLQVVTMDRDTLKADLDTERENMVRLSAQLGEAQVELHRITEEHEHARDERDLAVLDRDEWKRRHEQTEADFSRVSNDLADARVDFYNRETQYLATIRDLTAERDLFKDKFGKAKSMAAGIMALDQKKTMVDEPAEEPAAEASAPPPDTSWH